MWWTEAIVLDCAANRYRLGKNFILVPVASTLLASAAVNLQVRANGQLAVGGAHPLAIALGNMGLQLVAILLVLLFIPRIRLGVVTLVLAARERTVPLWIFGGGLVGAFVITLMGVVSPIVGVAVFTVALVAGQTTSSLLVDKWGLGPAGKRPVTLSRLLSTVVAVGAVVIAVSDRWDAASSNGWEWWGVALALIGGIAIAFQMAANGRIAKVSGQPAIGAGVNFLGGSLLLSILIVFSPSTGAQSFLGSSTPVWLYAGALFGFIIVFNAAWAVRHLGILSFTIVSVSGQVLGAVIIDLLLPTTGVAVTLPLIVGALLTLVAVAIGVVPGLSSRNGSSPNAR